MNILAQTTEAAENLPWHLKPELAFYENPNFLAIVGFILAIVISLLLGRWIAKRIRLAEISGKLSIILLCVMVSGIVFAAKSANTYHDSRGRTAMPFKFGVDLRGGVTIIGQMNEQKDLAPGERPTTIQDIIPRLKDRIDPSGVREIAIRALGKDKMEVIIPDVEPEEARRIWRLLITAGQLLFRIVADENKDTALVNRARETAAERLPDVYGPPDDEHPDGKKIGEWFSLARERSKDLDSTELLPFKFLPTAAHLVRDGDTGQIIDMASIPLSNDLSQARQDFHQWCLDRDIIDVQILMVEPPDDRQNVEGKYLKSVRQGFDQNANLRIEFNLDQLGGRKMWRLTSQNKRDGDRFRLLGIVLDDKLHAAPRINEPIRQNGVIEGSFTREEIQDYIAILSSGKLDVALRKNWISMDQVLSTLGEELKRKGLMAIGISLSIVLVFMVIYYRFCGIVACLALMFNLIFTLTVLLLINVNLTLTGLAGLVLTIGMSVDANVLIFERIREELRRGTALRMAIRNGFERASTTIVDANLTTLITAVILYVIGSEQIRSFSVTLIVGILMCMFTSIYCSRALFDIAERQRWIGELKMLQIVGSRLLDFLGKRRYAFAASLLVIGIGLTAFFYRGAGILDTDLAGGSTARVEFTQAKTVNGIKSELEAAEYTYNGDPIRYSVTQMADNVNAFKIDSSLPVIEDENAPSQISLDQIIADVFQGQLVMLDMNFDPNGITITQLATRGSPEGPSGGADNSADPSGPSNNDENDGQSSSGDDAGDGGKQLSWRALPASQWMSLTSSVALLLQDETKKPAVEKTEQQSSETNDTAQQTSSGELTTTQQESGQGDPDMPPAGAAKFQAVVTLQFAHPITGLSVKGYLMDTANELVIALRDDEIKLQADDKQLDETDRSQNWTLTLQLTEQNDARRLLEAVQAKMAAEPYFASSSGVGGQIAAETQRKVFVAMIASLIGIVGYVWIRFQNVAFGLAAIVALVHDVLVVLGAIAVSYWLQGVFGFLLVQDFRISLSVIAALLTIIGYSLNDTIVVFDRIREVRGKRTDVTAEIINKSISQTLSRTILTSLTTFLVVFILYLIGGDAIHAFAFSLVIGVIVGTYSSIFVASPTLLWLMSRGVSVEEPAQT